MNEIGVSLAQADPTGGMGGMANLIFIAGIFIVFYFFFIRPQTKKAKDQKNFIDEMKKGDKIVTAGGIHGKILQIEENKPSMLIEVDSNTKLRIEKSVVSLDWTKALNEGKGND